MAVMAVRTEDVGCRAADGLVLMKAAARRVTCEGLINAPSCLGIPCRRPVSMG